jgi:hypothetical protein
MYSERSAVTVIQQSNEISLRRTRHMSKTKSMTWNYMYMEQPTNSWFLFVLQLRGGQARFPTNSRHDRTSVGMRPSE